MTGVSKRMRGAGLVVGVLVAAMAGGFLANLAFQKPTDSASSTALREDFFQTRPVHATASDGIESLTIATGELDTGVEAVFMLDGVTGQLRGGVINTNTRKFSMWFNYDGLVADLGITTVKNPKFLLVTGELPFTAGRTGRLGKVVVYVAELNSGWVAAYGVPYDSTAYAAARPTTVKLVPLDRFKFRELSIRP